MVLNWDRSRVCYISLILNMTWILTRTSNLRMGDFATHLSPTLQFRGGISLFIKFNGLLLLISA